MTRFFETRRSIGFAVWTFVWNKLHDDDDDDDDDTRHFFIRSRVCSCAININLIKCSGACWTDMPLLENFEDIDSVVLRAAACIVHHVNVFVLLAIFCHFWIIYEIDKITKYRSIPTSRYFCDGILSSGISWYHASVFWVIYTLFVFRLNAHSLV